MPAGSFLQVQYCFRLPLLGQLLYRHVAEHDRIVVAGKPEVASFEILAGVGQVVFELGDFADIGVHDNAAVEFDLDR